MPEPTELDASLAADLDAGRAAGRYLVTDDAGGGGRVHDRAGHRAPGRRRGLSPAERYTAALAPDLRRGSLLIVSSPTAEHAGGVVAATVELLTGLQAGTDYALAHLFGPVPNGRMIVSGVDVASATRAEEWLVELGLAVMPVLPVAAAEVVAGLLARAGAATRGGRPTGWVGCFSGRREGAWWPPRSSKPTWSSSSARRVRFPSASATAAGSDPIRRAPAR